MRRKHAFLRSVGRFLTAGILLMAIWLSVPSALFYKPTSVTINGYDVTVGRTFPMQWLTGRGPWVEYFEKVHMVGGPDPCTDHDEFRYKNRGKPFANWNIEDWAAPCMRGDFHWSSVWRVKLFGVLPLRPVELDMFVPYDRWRGEQIILQSYQREVES